MILSAPGTFADALAWFVAHRRERLEVVLTTGGLTIEGPALYERVAQEDDDAFGIVLTGLCFWIIESEVEQVWIDPTDDGMLLLAGDLSMYLRPDP